MAEFENRDFRVNESAAELARLQKEQRAKLSALPSGPQYTTLPDGRVLDRQGVVVFKPTPHREETG